MIEGGLLVVSILSRKEKDSLYVGVGERSWLGYTEDNVREMKDRWGSEQRRLGGRTKSSGTRDG